MLYLSLGGVLLFGLEFSVLMLDIVVLLWHLCLLINIALVNTAGLSASHAWLGTLIITGVANFFVLSAMLGKTNDPGVLKRSQSTNDNTMADV
jgi:hypothetical protein